MTRLVDVIADVTVQTFVGDPAAVEVTGVVHDSRAVSAGSLFCCVAGTSVDGHDLAPEALEAGAAALLCERALPVALPQVVVESTRVAMGPVAAAFWDHPSRALDVVGVTGTNGKTTTVHLLHSILEAADRRAAIIGTLTGSRTTPEAPELQAQLAAIRDDGMLAVAMEVSSHALAMHRVDGTWFRVAVFTNLSRDHLDYHGDMESYFEAKAALFAPERCAAAVVNIDDPWGRRLASRLEVPWEPVSLGLVAETRVGLLWCGCRWDGVELRVPLGGRFNLANALAAAVAARTMGVAASTVAAGLAAAGPVPGRFEPVDAGQPFTVLVDYAHTPDGLEQVLSAAKEVAGGHRVIVVFGCGGDRDATKRAPMGAVATRLADQVVLTSDNPRSEVPGAIIDAVLRGMTDRSSVLVEADRRDAIADAVAAARAGDVVVIAGKGHETTQAIGDVVTPFDDRVVAREALERLEW